MRLKDFAEALKENKTLTKLDISCDKLKKSTKLQFINALKHNNTLTDLKIDNSGYLFNPISKALNKNFIDPLEKVYPDLYKNEMTAFQIHPFQIQGCDKILKVFQDENLTKIELKDAGIENVGVKIIAGKIKNNEKITSLDISGNEIDLRGIQLIVDALKSDKEPESDKEPKGNKTLKILNIGRNTGIGNIECRKIADLLEHNNTLTELNIEECDIIGEGILPLAKALKVHESLLSLNLKGNKIGYINNNSLAVAIRESKKLISVNVNDCGINVTTVGDWAEVLKNNSVLKKLNFGHNYVGNSGINLIAKALDGKNSLTELNLSHCNFESEAESIVANSLKKIKRVVSLSTNGLKIDYKTIESEGVDAFIKYLENETRFTKLDKPNKNKVIDELEKLTEVIKANKSILNLNYAENQQYSEGITDLIKNLQGEDKKLEVLDLSWNSLGFEGAHHLSDLLKVNKALKKLVLKKIDINDDGIKEIASSLEKNETLEVLDLSRNSFGCPGVQKLSDVLKCNKALKKLVLKENKIDDGGIKEIASSLKENKTLNTLVIHDYRISLEGVIYILEALKENNSLVKFDFCPNSNCKNSTEMKDIDEAVKKNLELLKAKMRGHLRSLLFISILKIHH